MATGGTGRVVVVVGGRVGVGGGVGVGVGVNLEQLRVTTLRPVQRRFQKGPEQGCRAVGAALELGVGLGGAPKRVVVEFDELH